MGNTMNVKSKMRTYTIRIAETTDVVLAESPEEARMNWFVQQGEKHIRVEE